MIKKFVEFTKEDFNRLGPFGYISYQKYEVKKEESQQAFSIHMNLVDLESPFKKQEMIDDEDIHRYRDMVKQGYSLGFYDDDKLVAIAVAEAQIWNNTLMLWHLQVHEQHRRKKYGSMLINEIIHLAQEHGFRAVTLETQNTNVSAIQFYKQCGFEIEGIDLSMYDGIEETALFMRHRVSYSGRPVEVRANKHAQSLN